MTARPDRRLRDAYDSVWKEALGRYLASFLALLFPKAWAQVDWSRPPERLDTELRKVVHDARGKDQRADQLFKVYLKDGGERFVLAHIEMQTVRDSRLAERMFGYCHRIYDRYKVPVAGFAALGDENGRRQVPQPDPQSDRFGWEALGSELSWRFQTVRLMDWESRWEDLLASRNPFAIVLMAYIRTKSTRNHPESRLGFKIAIARHLHATQPATEVPGLMRLLDWMMQLPEQHAIIFSEEIATLQTEHQMTYIPSFARGAWEDGRKDGQLSVLIQLLTQRFGKLPAAAQSLLDSAKGEAIEQWTKRLLEARTLEEVFGVPLPPRSRSSRRQTA